MIAEEVRNYDSKELTNIKELYNNSAWMKPTDRQIKMLREDAGKMGDGVVATLAFMGDILVFFLWKQLIPHIKAYLEGGNEADERGYVSAFVITCVMTIISIVITYKVLKREQVKIAEKVEVGDFEVINNMKVLKLLNKTDYSPSSFIVEVGTNKYLIEKFMGKPETTKKRVFKEFEKEAEKFKRNGRKSDINEFKAKSIEYRKKIKETKSGVYTDNTFLVKTEIEDGLILRHKKQVVYLYFA